MTSDSSYFHYRSPYGVLTIGTDGQAITALELGARSLNGYFKAHELTNLCSTQVLEYLAGKRWTFDLALKPEGTPFQQSVWQELLTIGYGDHVTVSTVAARLQCPEAYRRVGAAINQNPIAILIPSHRVVTAQGLPRPSSPTAAIDSALLLLESKHRQI